VLDEFIVIFIIIYCCCFSVSFAECFGYLDGSTMLILFSSPNISRWTDGKGGMIKSIGFGMELWSHKELSEMSTFVQDYTPYLCKENDILFNGDIVYYLTSFGINDRPCTLLRRDFFGLQPRFEFCSSDELCLGFSELEKSLNKTIENRNLRMPDAGNKSEFKSHKILKLAFDVDTRKFVEIFVSEQ
jgi:hypothetical protein